MDRVGPTCGAALRQLNAARSPQVETAPHNAASAGHALADLDALIAVLDVRLAMQPYLPGKGPRWRT